MRYTLKHFVFLLFLIFISTSIANNAISQWYNSPQCSTDSNFCQVYCPEGTVLIDCIDVGNGTSLQPNCDYKTNSCTARPDPGEEGSPACEIVCQNPFPEGPNQSIPPPISGSKCKKIVQFTFEVTEEMMNLDGALRPVLAINQNIPGPTINVDLGDAIHIHVVNNLPSGMPLSFHWYGLPQLSFPYFDGVSNITECPSCPGQTIDYLFCPDVAGTYWYHSSIEAQRVDGLFGTIIVNDPNIDPYQYYDDERVVLVTEWYHRGSEEIENELNSMQWIGDFLPGRQSALICSDTMCSGCAENCTNCCSIFQNNFKDSYCGSNNSAPGVQLDCSAAQWMEYNVNQNESYRFRFISAASSYFLRISIDNHQLQIVAVDGNHLVEPTYVEFFDIGMGQRYDVIIEANQTLSNYWIRAEGPRNFGAYAILHYVGGEEAMPNSTYAPNSLFMMQESTTPYIQLNLTSNNSEIKVANPTLEIAMKIGCCENLTCTSRDCSDSLPSSTPSITLSTSLTSSKSLSPSSSHVPNTPSMTPSLSSVNFTSSPSPSITSSSSLSFAFKQQINEKEDTSLITNHQKRGILPGYTFGINDFNRTHAVDSYCNYPDGLVKKHSCWMRLLSNNTLIYDEKAPFIYPDTPSILTAYEAGEKTFPPPQNTIVLNAGDVVRVVVNNEDVHSVHSLHLHGHSFLVLGQGAQLVGAFDNSTDYQKLNLKNPIERDTILILPNSWVVIQFTASNPGTWFFHDQLQWNLLAGLGIVFNEMTDQLSIPPGNSKRICGACGAAFVPQNDTNASLTPSPTITTLPSPSNATLTPTSSSNDTNCDNHTGLWILLIIISAIISAILGILIGVAAIYFYVVKRQENMESQGLVNNE